MNNSRTTCLIPTHNRSRFVRRFLNFYDRHALGIDIQVVDSSRPDEAAANLQAISGSSFKQQPVHYRHENANFVEKIIRALSDISTPYVVLCADDDMLFRRSIEMATQYLDDHPECSVAMGRIAMCYPQLPTWCCLLVKAYDIDDDAPLARSRHIMQNWFSNLYGVYRTDTLLKMFSITAEHTDVTQGYHLPEMMLSHLSMLYGRTQILPALHMVMERHKTNAAGEGRVGFQANALELYARFKNGLVETFAAAGESRSEMEQFVDEAYGRLRVSDLAERRRKPIGQKIGRLLLGLQQKAADRFEPRLVRHRRLIRRSDVANCREAWLTAVQLIQRFPTGIDLEDSLVSRKIA